MKTNRGQALIPVLIIIILVLSLGVAALDVSISNILLSVYEQEGRRVFLKTESALEEGFLKLLRNPNYLGESLQFEETSCTIVVAGSVSSKTVTVTCSSGKSIRKAQAQADFLQGKMTVSWIKEIS